MKKIISILICISVLLSSFSFTFAYSDVAGNKYETDIAELTAIGLVSAVNEDEFLPDMRMTRGDFCMLVMSILGTGFSSPGTFFSDVTEDHKGFDAIGAAAASGYMIGYGDGTFRPDDSITLAEASKVLVEFLNYGYKVLSNGDSSSAYVMTAKEIGLYKGLDIPFSEELTRGESARLINNALDVPLPVASGISNDGSTNYKINDEKTALTEYLKLKRDEGQVSASSVIALPGSNFAGDNQISVNGVIFEITNSFQLEYVGYNVRYIYELDDDSEVKKLIYIAKENNRECVINRDDYESFSGNVFVWLDENEKEREVKLSSDAVIIYNGQLSKYSRDMFSKVKSGKFTFISSEGNSIYNVVYIEEYSNYVIGSVNKTEIMITDYVNAENKIRLSPDNADYVLIYDENGAPADFSIFKKKQSISVVDNTKYKKVYVNKESVTGKILSKDEETFNIDGEVYEIAPEVKDEYADLILSQPYDFYFDRFGRIFYVEIATGFTKNYVYFMSIKEDQSPLQSELRMKVYSMEEAAMTAYYVNNVLSINRESYNNITAAKLTEILSEPQLIAVEFTEDGKIKSIETAKLEEEYGENEDGIVKTTHASRTFYGDPLNCFNYLDYLAEGARIISVPQDTSVTDISYFSTGKAVNWFDTGTSYSVTLFSSSRDAEYVDVVMRKTASASNAVSVSVVTPVSVVSKVTKTVNENGEQILRIYSIYAGNERSVDYVLSDDLYDTVESSTGKRVYLKDVKPGDVIITSNNGKGTVGNFRYLYDYENGIHYDRFGSENSGGAYYRVLSRNVTNVSTNFVRLEKEGKSPMKIAHSGITIVTVSNNGKATFVKKGSIDDIEKDDTVLIQTQSRIPRYLIVFKK